MPNVEALTRRPAKFIPDYLVPMPSHLLATTLSDLIQAPAPSSPTVQHPPRALPQGHHLVYFPIQTPPSGLAADGADPDHGPGGVFARRMAWGCREGIERVDVRGRDGQEKVFVDVWRRYGLGHEVEEMEYDIEERRTLVFMRNAEQTSPPTPRRPIKYPHPPTLSASLLPRPAHLFHFSALTFNAHAIHLDPSYARATDGHRALLVHGPLTLALMLRVLAAAGDAQAPPGKVKRIAYRNYAPLYVDEEMRVCVRDVGGRNWDVWVDGPGGLAVKGTAEMDD
ncbi:Hydroxyacyl-thioester dehydratase type 2, mitochondrial [Tolypocladium ophioglossoides CBS 100239]|uniref:Hydroxyacyl-thioester dehydratase type 2, mitochondrial n=1 Tax=Tolypocladium ophioglossoides (strain CBS 100239) TaxID=1163406 RepID=A0A0L0NE57_TOLOC|nr:Hydroxyacyl-thioester dehydratase type 2, mitochondrial [Tolypocladium ophioglossoides CBS 100239]